MRALVFVALSACVAAAQAATVAFGGTTLLGADITTLHQELFAGIPFAQPPLGALRLRPPVLKTDLNVTTFNATNFGPACIQIVRVSSASSRYVLTDAVRIRAQTSPPQW
jgi:acetylcholinesterase